MAAIFSLESGLPASFLGSKSLVHHPNRARNRAAAGARIHAYMV
jgi:hypothetical protein